MAGGGMMAGEMPVKPPTWALAFAEFSMPDRRGTEAGWNSADWQPRRRLFGWLFALRCRRCQQSDEEEWLCQGNGHFGAKTYGHTRSYSTSCAFIKSAAAVKRIHWLLHLFSLTGLAQRHHLNRQLSEHQFAVCFINWATDDLLIINEQQFSKKTKSQMQTGFVG